MSFLAFMNMLQANNNVWDSIERRGCLKVNGNLAKLREMTSRLIDTIKSKTDNTTDLITKNGFIKLTTLYSNKDVGIASFICSAGSIHELHSHPMNEWIGISSGKLIIHFLDKDVIVNQYEVMMITKDTPHRMEYVEETTGWVVTMPKDEGF